MRVGTFGPGDRARTACELDEVGPTETDPTLEVLSADQCRRLLATRQLGRIGLAGGRFPLILPVNYAVDGDVIVVRTDSRSILAGADHGRVAFEVDEIDERTRSGWSVLAQAVAQEVTAADRDDLLARTRASGVEPWAPGTAATGSGSSRCTSPAGGSCRAGCRRRSRRRPTRSGSGASGARSTRRAALCVPVVVSG